MKGRLLLALVPAMCLCWQAREIHAQQASVQIQTAAASGTRSATGRITGVVKDPSGAVVPGATVEASNLSPGFRESVRTDWQGRFLFRAVPAGRYRITVKATGFGNAVFHDISVRAHTRTVVNAVLRVASVSTDVQVGGNADLFPAAQLRVSQADRERSRNAAELLKNVPGVSLRGNGELASVPLLHGLGDERTRLLVNGMSASSSCPNHMNPPLSYIVPSDAAEVTVMAGITPVSLGGDSLGGTVSVESGPPVFAGPGGRVHEEGSTTGFYRSNGRNYGGSVSEWIAGHNLGIGYTGSWVTSDDYTDGSGAKITSTYAQSTDHTVTLAAQGAGNLFVLRAGLHHMPYQGFVNERMDMVRNYAASVNLHYHRSLGPGALDGHGFWQNTSHSMNIGRDKLKFPMAMWMPMNDHGTDLGYSVKYELPVSALQTLRVGNELHRFVLNDAWPPTTGMGMAMGTEMMGPDTFINVNNGRRTRLGTFAELASQWNPRWSTLIGARNDTVWSNAGSVHGYSDMDAADAAAFNGSDRARTDVDFDATAMVRYEPGDSSTFELGYARKTRAPNLYERYAWSTDPMASSMIGWFGDGNSYVGNLELKPEVAHTVSGTVGLHDHAHQNWEIKVTPYETYIQDYVDVNTLATMPEGMSTFAQLRFANHKARIYGGDLSGSGVVWNSSRFGKGRLGGVAGWLHGERLDTRTGLYQMMPLNLRINFDEELGGWTAGAGVEGVDGKSNVDPHRFEPKTPGYTLFDLHTAYRWERLRMSAAVSNLLNKEYALPLGGVNLDNFLAGGSMGQVEPVTGRGRSAGLSVTFQF